MTQTPQADPPRPYQSRLRDPSAWLWAAAGLAMLAYGIYKMVRAGTPMHMPAWFWVGVGLSAMPLVPIGLLGALMLFIFAGWLATHAAGPLDYVFVAVAAFIGGSRVLESWQHHRARRGVLPADRQ